ncbi:hypothetical protein [Victivallis sp. Marseille-Q1083]|uniref:hypothetical protein n=1 Tax=Victivallis sp. Marseille-Q1083 TaxID=2717288 RepID=UPI0015898039|nr:hypothetical protein [Victivallis sp. Marseille-Q1083]
MKKNSKITPAENVNNDADDNQVHNTTVPTAASQEDSGTVPESPVRENTDCSNHRVEFVMQMPDCVVDPAKREQAIRYFQEDAGGTQCWNEVKEFLKTAECTVDEHGNPHFVSTVGNMQELMLPEAIDQLDWAWRNTMFDVLLKSGMVNLSVKPN